MYRPSVIAAAAGAVLLAGPASAEVNVFADIFKQKDKTITETINIDKDVTLVADVDSTPDKAAESEALLNQTNLNNEGCENCAEKTDRIDNSVNGNSGTVAVNQATGNMNNQGNAISNAIDLVVIGDDGEPEDTDGSGFAESQASAEQVNGAFGGDLVDGPTAQQVEGGGNLVETVNLLFRDAFIDDSVNDNSGIAHVNQSSGNMANQGNTLSIALSLRNEGVALSEADLGQFNQGNLVRESDASGQAVEVGIEKRSRVGGSMNGNTGVLGANQTSGNMANQGNVVSISAAQVGG